MRLRDRFMRLLGARSPSESERWAALGAEMTQAIVRGMEQSDARRAGLVASGLTPEEAQAVMVRELILNTHPAFLAHTELIVMRSFGSLYDDG